MKTQISKLFFVFGATIVYLGLFSPTNVQAQQTQFNNLSNDKPTVQVTNYTNNPNCNSCWSTSTTAKAGDLVSVYIYYHNTGTVAAQNTTLKLTQVGQGINSTQHTISGSVGASNANTVSGSATINLTSSQALVFDNFVRWYPNQIITSSTPLPNGQSGNEVFGNGVNIGNIGPDSYPSSFSTQGSLVVRFKVTNNQIPTQNNCVIQSFGANPQTVSYGFFSSLNWNTTNCNNLMITGAMSYAPQNPSGAVSTNSLFNPTNTYTLSGYGDNGLVQQSVTVTVTGQPSNNCVINYFNASPNSNISNGGTTLLSWNTQNCNNVSISGGNTNQSGLPANHQITSGALFSNTTFTLTAFGNNGNDTKQVSVTVLGSSGGNTCRIDDFYASPSRIDEGDRTTLFWETTNCTNVHISNGIGNVSNDGDEETPRLYDDETYTITASNSTSSDSETITVRVDEDDDECRVDDFYASPSSVTYGGSTRLYWETTDADSVYISNLGSQPKNGNKLISNIYSTTTYTITVYCNGHSDTDSVTVNVHQQPIHESTSVTTLGVQNVTRTSADLAGVLVYTGVNTTNVWFEYGTSPSMGNITSQSAFHGSVNTPFTKNISGLTPNTLYYFKAIASNQSGRTEGVVRTFRTLGETTTNTNTIVYVSSGTGVSLLDLDLTSSFENVGIGEQYDIDITYENTSGTVTARDTTLNIVLPKNLTFQRISRGEYNLRDHIIFVDLEDVGPKEKGEITLQVRVGSRAQSGELLVTIGTLNYEKNGVKEEVIDILTNKVTADGSVLGAFALGGGFWPNTLVGWLILLIIFMMIVYIANKMFRRKNIAQPMSVPVPPQTYR